MSETKICPHCGRPETDDYLIEVYRWALSGMEGCDEPEWSLFSSIVDAIENYMREINNERCIKGVGVNE